MKFIKRRNSKIESKTEAFVHVCLKISNEKCRADVLKLLKCVSGSEISDSDIRETSDRDQKLCRRPSTCCETGTGSSLDRQDCGNDNLDDSDLYDTDVETLTGATTFYFFSGIPLIWQKIILKYDKQTKKMTGN